MKRIVLSALLAFSLANAAECSYELVQPKVSWKAFKLYEKVGVKGGFDNVEFTYAPQASVDASLTGATVNITTKSVNSGNKGRDDTLVKSFFDVQGVTNIKATIKEAKNGKLIAEITMNKVTKLIPMHYALSAQNMITGGGVIDLADFDMLSSLKSINKACYDLHGGKTWQDVELEFSMGMTKKCN